MKNSCRSVWLRQDGSCNPPTPGKKLCMMLSAIGNAAARETLVTAAPHMAAIWKDMFNSLLVPDSSSLCWRDNGPGIGRDARTAYSGLLGRYMARAYLTEHEGVLILVPLDKAKCLLERTGYAIGKLSDGYEADWIGLDDSGLVIVEAKGTYYPPISYFKRAIGQVGRTAVFRSYQKLPTKRWAIASRWGTEENSLKPTLVAWDSEEEQLDADDYNALYQILHRADVGGVLRGMGHPIHTQAPNVEELIADVPSGRLSIYDVDGNQQLEESGFAAVVGPFGVRFLRPRDDLSPLLQLLDRNFSYAVALLSHSHVHHVLEKRQIAETIAPDEFEAQSSFTDVSGRLATQHGLTVVWLRPGDNVAFEQE